MVAGPKLDIVPFIVTEPLNLGILAAVHRLQPVPERQLSRLYRGGGRVEGAAGRAAPRRAEHRMGVRSAVAISRPWSSADVAAPVAGRPARPLTHSLLLRSGHGVPPSPRAP